MVHPVLSVVLTASDDMTIRMFDWEKDWRCVREFVGHQHYVMGLSIVSSPLRRNLLDVLLTWLAEPERYQRLRFRMLRQNHQDLEH